MYFDRFDICEAHSLWAHDYGEYAVITRLDRMGFRPSPLLAYDTLSTNARGIYDALAARAGYQAALAHYHATARAGLAQERAAHEYATTHAGEFAQRS